MNIERGTEWRFLRGWSSKEIKKRLSTIERLKRSFALSSTHDETRHWRSHHSEGVVVSHSAAPHSFDELRSAVAAYRFSDPSIVRGYFDPEAPLLGRRMLLEIQVLGFRFLCATVVSEVLERRGEGESLFAFRYDTLEGHLESGMEWFILRHDHRTGETRFRIEALWRPGSFPNWWSRVGFFLLARPYQRKWHRMAYARLKAIGANKKMSKNQIQKQEITRSVAIGILAGMRTFSAPAAVVRAKYPRLQRPVEALAVFEMLGDKLPSTPSRIKPASLAARGISGAISAVLASTPDTDASIENRRPRHVTMHALIGGITAVISTFGFYYCRRALGTKLGIQDHVLGLVEDAAAVQTRKAIHRKIA
jgi:uncharacterized membrane protein/uncharacterized protein (UPF0548 family)